MPVSKEKSRENYHIYRKRNGGRVWLWLKNNPCVDCGESDPRVLEFDHVCGVKHKSIAKMLSGTYSWDTIFKEMGKCEVRCANCHRKITFERASFKNWITQEDLDEAKKYYASIV